jgi:hypothetical protein
LVVVRGEEDTRKSDNKGPTNECGDGENRWREGGDDGIAQPRD